MNGDPWEPGDISASTPDRLASTATDLRTLIAVESAEVRAGDTVCTPDGMQGPGAAQAGTASPLDLHARAAPAHRPGAITSRPASTRAAPAEAEGSGTVEMETAEDVECEPSPAPSLLPPALSIVGAGDMLSPAREITATTPSAKILFTRDDLDTTYVSGRRGMMVLSLVEDGTSYRVGRYDVESGEWRILSKGWPRFGNALAFACTIVS